MTEEKLDLSDKSVLEKVEKQAADILEYTKTKESFVLMRKIESSLRDYFDLEKKDSLLWQRWQNLLVKVRWISFPFLNFNEVIRMFEKNLVDAFNLEGCLLESELKVKFLVVPLLEERDNYKKELREAMLKNSQKITSADILVNGKMVQPTVSNWLGEYNRLFGTGEVGQLEQMKFLTANPNILKLSSEEKAKIKRLVALYEKLKLSSLTPEGIEEGGAIKRGDRLEIMEGDKVVDVIRLGEPKIPALSIRMREEKKEIEEEQIPSLPLIGLSQAVDNIVRGLGLDFVSPDQKKRFQNIAGSFLQDARGEIETRIILKRDPKIGGAGLDDKIVDEIIEDLKEQKPRVKLAEKPGPDETQAAESFAEAESSQKKEGAEAVQSFQPKEEKVEEKVIEEVQPSHEKIAEAESSQKEEEVGAVQSLQSKDEESEEKNAEEILPLQEKIAEIESQKEKEVEVIQPQKEKKVEPLEEIKVKPRAYSPVDELRTLTLADWRRWGTAQQAAEMVQDKINLLAEEEGGLSKKAEGIKAWKESEINRLYLKIGEESINNGVSVKEIIVERQKQGHLTLTEEEFNTVVELNEKLRF